MTHIAQKAHLRDRAFLAALIDQVGISERYLARQASLSHSTVNHLITGRRTCCSVDTAHSIAYVLGISTRTLFDI